MRPLLTLALIASALSAAASPAAARERCRPADIVFLIDISYSFGNAKATREAFAQGIGSFLDGIGPEHRIGLVTFGTDAQTKVALASHNQMTRDEIVRQISLFKFRDPWTNVAAGVEHAWRLASAREGRRGVVIMISDGAISMPDPDKPGSRRESDRARALQRDAISALYAKIKQSDTQFYTLAYVGANTDYALMKELADSTDGMAVEGTTAELPSTMSAFASQWCERDPKPVERWRPVKATPTSPATPATPTTPAPTAPPTPTTPPLAPPVPPPPPLPLWLALVAIGASGVGTGIIVSRVVRRRKTREVAALVAQREAERAERAAKLAAEAEEARRQRRRRARAAEVEERLAAARSRDELEDAAAAVTIGGGSGAAPRRAPRRDRGSKGSRAEPPRPRRPGRPVSTPGQPTFIGQLPPTAPRGAREAVTGDKPGPPPKPTAPPRHGGENIVWIVAYRGNGEIIRQVEFRGNGDQITVIGPMAEALLDQPDEGIKGAVRLTVDRDGERVVRISEVPPGGFTDLKTGASLGNGARLYNNQRFAWVREGRRRYCEVIYK